MQQPTGRMVHAVVGRALVEDILKRRFSQATPEQRTAVESRVAAISIRLQILSRYASFVAVGRSTEVALPPGPSATATATVSANAPLQVAAITEDLLWERRRAQLREKYEAAAQARGIGEGGLSTEELVRLVRGDAESAQKVEAMDGDGASATQAESVDCLWEDAMALAQELPTTHHDRLTVAMKYAAFLQEAGRPDEACDVSRDAFEDAIAELDNVSEDSYKDSTLVMQQIRDNLTVWTSNGSGDVDPQNIREVLRKSSADLPKKHGRGGQSALRFARLRIEKRRNYAKKVTEQLLGKTAETGAPAPALGDASSAALDTLQPLLLLQSFDGSWELTSPLADALGTALGGLAPGDESGAVWATALALAFLDLRLASRAEEWALVAEKAHTWLRSAGHDSDVLVALARDRLRELGVTN